jgi:predicted ATPase
VIGFPPFRLDVTDERLWRGDSPVELRPKALAALRYLVEHAGSLVTRDELLDAIWPETAIAPEALTQVIAELRRALGDDARHPDFIQTVHRRGFRFVAGVEASRDGRDTLARPGPQSAPGALPLFGRDAELARLDELLNTARNGQRQMAFVTGEPGIGKTSLIRTFLERLAEAEESEWIAVGRCVEHHGEGEAFLPVLNALDRLARESGARPLVRCLSRYAPSWMALMPWLSRPDEADEIEHAPLATTPTRMLREFCVAVEALSEERTLVVWLEDLHWADPSTVDLLAALATRPDSARLLVLATYRPVDAASTSHPIAPLKRSLVEHDQCEELKLDPLDAASTKDYLSARLASEADPGLAALIHEQTEGNPLFVVTLVNHLFAGNWLKETRAGWKLATPLDELRSAAPESLGALVETQLDRLDAEELELLQAASVQGDTFAAQSIAAAAGREVEEVEKICGRLAAWGRFIESSGPGRWPDGSAGEGFHFLHAAFRHFIYRSLSAGVRQGLHCRTAQRLEEGFGSKSIVMGAELALHFERGGDPDRAVECLVAAAEGVRQRAGDREAVTYFERALSVLATLPESADRDRRELELRMHLWRELYGSAIVSTDEQNASIDRALELCERLGDSRSRAFLLSFRTRSLIIQGELDAAESLDERRVQRASALGDPLLLAAAHGLDGDIAFFRGDLDRAVQEQTLCLRALEGIDAGETTRLFGVDAVNTALGRLGRAHWFQGRPDRARRDAEACLELAEADRSPLTRALATVHALMVEQLRRDADAAQALAKTFLELLDEHGFALSYPIVHSVTSRPQSGERDASIERLRQAIAANRRMGMRLGSARLLSVLAEMELERGHVEEGLAAIDDALALVEETGERFVEAEIHRIRGELLRLDGENERAEACFATALEVASKQGALSLELRAATSLARQAKHAKRGPEARRRLAEVYGRFSEGFDTADLQDAAKLLDSP